MTEPTLSELLVELSEKVTTLFRQEAPLAKAEIQESVASPRRGLVLVVADGAILYSAAVVLLGAVVLGLANWLGLPLWLSALLVATVVGSRG